jgi:flagellar hook-associated protein 3 FlgL
MNRIGFNYRFDSASDNIGRAEQNLFLAQQRLSTGKKFTRSSEDPLGGGMVVRSQRVLDRVIQFKENLTQAKGAFGVADNALGEITPMLKRASQLAVQGANGTLDQTQRDAIKQEVSNLKAQIVKLSNSQDAKGNYLFAGQQTETKPYTVVNDALVFNGDNLPINSEVRTGEYMRTNAEGTDSAFQDIFTALTSLEDHLAAGQGQLISNYDLDAIKNASDSFNAIRGQIGSKMQTVESELGMNQSRQDDLKKSISDVQEIDLAEAMVDYQKSETAYTAALQTATRGPSLSLLDFMS